MQLPWMGMLRKQVHLQQCCDQAEDKSAPSIMTGAESGSEGGWRACWSQKSPPYCFSASICEAPGARLSSGSCPRHLGGGTASPTPLALCWSRFPDTAEGSNWPCSLLSLLVWPRGGNESLGFRFCVSTEWLSRQQCPLWVQAVKRALWRSRKRAVI